LAAPPAHFAVFAARDAPTTKDIYAPRLSRDSLRKTCYSSTPF
jgi:hypothetical protein